MMTAAASANSFDYPPLLSLQSMKKIVLDDILGFAAYEKARLSTTTRIVHTNRTSPPDYINIKVEELTGDRPFENLDKFIRQDELRALSDNYKRIAGFGQQDVA